jgi:formyl-CoA transferase
LAADRGLLHGLRIVEFAEMISGPMAGGFLADHGADVIHVECPATPDPARAVGPTKDGAALWWKVLGRNKRAVTIAMDTPDGQELAHQLIATADVVITNLAWPRLEAWGVDPPTLRGRYPRLIVLHVSGYGANSSRRDEPGVGKVAEAQSGLAELTGVPGRAPVFSGFAQAETLAALTGAFAIQAAIYRRDTAPDGDVGGEWIDLALFEPLFRLIEWQAIVHDQIGTIFERNGNQMALGSDGVVDTYQTADGEWIIVTSGTDRGLDRLEELLGCAIPARDTSLIKELLADWVHRRTTQECVDGLTAAGVSASRIYSAADIANDENFIARRSIVAVGDDDLGQMRMTAALPHVRNHPGQVWRTGPPLGADNEAVFRDLLGMSADEFARLTADGII